MLNMINEIIAIETRCPFCGKTAVIEVPIDDYMAWLSGATVQRAFPNLDANVREQLISGICPTCWDKMFSVPEDEEEEENDYEDTFLEMDYNPYMGCYDYE